MFSSRAFAIATAVVAAGLLVWAVWSQTAQGREPMPPTQGPRPEVMRVATGACRNLKEGARCHFNLNGVAFVGACRKPPTGAALACTPAPATRPPEPKDPEEGDR